MDQQVPDYLGFILRRLENRKRAPVAQLDRVPGYEPGGREFESLRARQYSECHLRSGTSQTPHSVRFAAHA